MAWLEASCGAGWVPTCVTVNTTGCGFDARENEIFI